MFIVLQGKGTLRLAGELVPIKAGGVIVKPAVPG
jgi:quercetin dioxygenase-like cupin family protein